MRLHVSKTMRKGAIAVLTAVLFSFISCNNETSDDSGGSPSNNNTSVAGLDYSGSYTVAGKHFSMISLDSNGGKYTMEGSDGTDTGSFVSRSARITVSDGSYVLTSDTLGGTFTLKVSGKTVKLEGGSISASGSGGSLYTLAVPELPTPVGTNEFAGLNLEQEETDSQGVTRKYVMEFDSKLKHVQTKYKNGTMEYKRLFNYSYNSDKHLFYAGFEGYTFGKSDYDEETGLSVSAGETWYRDDWAKAMITLVEHGINKEVAMTTIKQMCGRGEVLQYSVAADRKSLTMTDIFPESGKIEDIVGGSFRTSDRGVRLDDCSLEIRGDRILGCIIADDGSNLELAVLEWDDPEEHDTLGYMSASYTTTGKGTNSATCRLTITAVQDKLGTPYTNYKNKVYDLTFDGNTFTWPNDM